MSSCENPYGDKGEGIVLGERTFLKCGDPFRVSRKTFLVPGIMGCIFFPVALYLLINSYKGRQLYQHLPVELVLSVIVQ